MRKFSLALFVAGGFLFILFCSLFCPSRGGAQSLNATISGTVTDPTGAAIPNADLALVALSTGAVARVPSGPDGLYRFANLGEDSYELKVSANGFKEYIQRGIVLHLNQSVRLDVVLQLGTTTQSVEVRANASPLNFESPEVKGEVSRKQLGDLPLQVAGNQRSVASFVTVLPGVTPASPTDQVFAARFNGGQEMTDEAIMDGVSMVEGVMSQSGMVSFQAWPVTPETVGEVSVLTSNYDVQYGFSNGAVITVSTKAGTSEFHGGGFEFLRNTSLNTRQFGVATRPKDIENDFGGYVGGPLKFLPWFSSSRKKTYFFVDFDGYRSRGAASKPILTVPTAKMRNGDFSEWPNPIYDPNTTCTLPGNPACATDAKGNTIITRNQFMGCNGATPNVICPSDPRLAASLAPQWLKFVPLPNLPGLTANWEAPNALANSLFANTNEWTVRGDQYYGDKDHIFVTWQYQGTLPFTQHAFPAVIDTNVTRIPNYTEAGRLNWDRTLKPNLLNHFAFGFLDLPTGQFNASDCCVDQVPAIAGVFSHKHEPSLSFSEYSGYGNSGDFYQRRPTYIGNDMLTWVRGKHTLHIGGEYRKLMLINTGEANGAGSFFFSDLNTGLLGIPSGNAMASFLLGGVSSANATFYTLSSYRPRGDAWALFIGDTWKATSKLTVNAGLRWDVNRPDVEVSDRTSFLDPVGPNAAAGNRPGRLAFAGTRWGAASFGRRHAEETFYKGFGPRLGLAYSFTPRTVVRAGYGVFFEQAFYPGWNGGIATDGFNGTASFSSSLGGLQPAFLLQNGFPQNFKHPPFIDSSFLNGQGAPNYRPFDANRLPYAQQWNLTVEHQFTDDFYVSTAYVGNKGTRLLSSTAPLNALDPKLLAMGNKLYDQFQPGQTTLDGVPIPYVGWVEQMTGCPPTVAQALLPYPQYCGNIYALNENAGNSTYHSLQVKAEKRFSHGVWMLTSYTLSKNLTDSDSVQISSKMWSGLSGVISPFERKRNKGLSDADLSQILAVSLTYELPFGDGKRLLNKGGALNQLVGGWQTTSIFRANSGPPMFFRSSFCNVPRQFAAGCIPGIRPGTNLFAQPKGSFDPGQGPLFNMAAFEPASGFNFYTGQGSRVSNLRGFGYHNQDFVLSKETRITEKVGIQLRVEAFNLWNWHVFVPSAFGGTNVVNTDVSSPTFGLWAGGVSPPRVVQIGTKILF